MVTLPYHVAYEPLDGSSSLDAYDAAQSMLGMARSLAVLTHYCLHSQLIKQAPSLTGAKILALPPQSGSFLLPFSINIDPDIIADLTSLTLGVFGNYIHDFTKYAFRKISGLHHLPETNTLKEIIEKKPGDIEAISDTINEDVIRIHRPLMHNVQTFNIYGNKNHIGTFNHSTLDFAKSKELGPPFEEFIGTIAAMNANSDVGRIWVETEGRTIPFKRDQGLKRLSSNDRQLLSWSLDQYTNRKIATDTKSGQIRLIGQSLRNREDRVTKIFVKSVDIISK